MVLAGLVLRVFRLEVNSSGLAGGMGGGGKVGRQDVPFVPSVQRPMFLLPYECNACRNGWMPGMRSEPLSFFLGSATQV